MVLSCFPKTSRIRPILRPDGVLSLTFYYIKEMIRYVSLKKMLISVLHGHKNYHNALKHFSILSLSFFHILNFKPGFAFFFFFECFTIQLDLRSKKQTSCANFKGPVELLSVDVIGSVLSTGETPMNIPLTI